MRSVVESVNSKTAEWPVEEMKTARQTSHELSQMPQLKVHQQIYQQIRTT